MSLVFHRRTASFRRQIDENSRSLSGPGLRAIPGRLIEEWPLSSSRTRKFTQNDHTDQISCPCKGRVNRNSSARRSAADAITLPKVPPGSRQAQHRSGVPERALAFAAAALRLRSSADQPEFDGRGARILPRSASVAGHSAVGSALEDLSAVAHPAAPSGRRQAAAYRRRTD